MKYIQILKVEFMGKKNTDWNAVEAYFDRYNGKKYTVQKYGDDVLVNALSADEFANSKYSGRLRGALAKVKANMVTVLPELIENADNRRWVENKSCKHVNDASRGWYRYDVGVEIPVKSLEEIERRWNKYCGTLIVRCNDNGLLFYDIINIKKEVSTPPES